MPTLSNPELAEALEGANSLILRWGHNQMRQLKAEEVERIVAALKASASSESAGWVSVEDRLPPVDVPVLAMWDFSNKDYYECPHVVACYNGRIWHNPDDTDDDYLPPKRWMAIPKAPSGER